MNEKMTDEELNLIQRDAALPVEHQSPGADERGRLLAHIAALTVERDALGRLAIELGAELDDLRRSVEELHSVLGTNDGTPHGPGLVEAARALRKKADEADALRERVQAQTTYKEAWRTRADVAESRLSAIRQRAGDTDGLVRVGEVCAIMGSPNCEWDDAIHEDVRQRGDDGVVRDVATGTARFIVGNDAPAAPPSQPPQTDDLDAIEQRHENQGAEATTETTAARLLREERETQVAAVRRAAEPTTAEAFVTVRKHLYQDDYEDGGETLTMIALLERRMGAMVPLLRFFRQRTAEALDTDVVGHVVLFRKGAWEARGYPPPILTVAHVRAALTDAPPVFTQEEVEKALVATGIGPVACEQVLGCLKSMRRES
jgi:hypothetical protein